MLSLCMYHKNGRNREEAEFKIECFFELFFLRIYCLYLQTSKIRTCHLHLGMGSVYMYVRVCVFCERANCDMTRINPFWAVTRHPHPPSQFPMILPQVCFSVSLWPGTEVTAASWDICSLNAAHFKFAHEMNFKMWTVPAGMRVCMCCIAVCLNK